VSLNGDVFVTGEVQTDARVDIGATGVVTLNTSGEPFWLNGGNNTDDPNTIAGGTISGAGVLAATDGRALHGFGTVDVNVDFDGAANLLAKDGTLLVTANIGDVGTLGTVDGSGVLDVQNNWNSDVANVVFLNGGELRGGVITNAAANGLNGFGLISSRVINSTRVDAEGSLLIVETANNDNDWDGPLDDGSLNAVSGDLHIRDNAAFQFAGTVSAAAGYEVFVNGFELELQLGSTLSLADGARYRSTHGTHIGGSVLVPAGAASLEIVGTTVFENASTTMLTGDLQLENDVTVVEAGATFTGGGALSNALNRTLILLDGANVGVLIENQGTLELGASPGQVQGIDYQQDSSGTLEIELAGTNLNDFDRLTLSGQAMLAGTLDVSLTNGFMPSGGQQFTILTASSIVNNGFVLAGSAASSFTLLVNSTSVILQAISVGLPGDYNNDGTVDAADYVVWQKTDGTPQAYDTWRAHFGETSGSGSIMNGEVPEPTTLVLLMWMAARCWARRQWAA
jgi:hypothetical protein